MPTREKVGAQNPSMQELVLTPEQRREIEAYDYTEEPGFSEETHPRKIRIDRMRWGLSTDDIFEGRFNKSPLKRSTPMAVIGQDLLFFGRMDLLPNQDAPSITTRHDMRDFGVVPVKRIAGEDFAKEEISDEAADVINIFKRVEDNLPDFSRHAAGAFRDVMGINRSYYQWSREEAEHSNIAGLILEATRKRTRKELGKDYYETQKNTFELPFSKDIEMILYAMFQERNTHGNYNALAVRLRSEGAMNSALAMTKIASDEQYHGLGYWEYAEAYARLSPKHAVEAAKAALKVAYYFEMPSLHLMRDRLADTIKVVETIGYNQPQIESMLIASLKALSFVPEGPRERVVKAYWPAHEKRIKMIARQYAVAHKGERDIARELRRNAKNGGISSNGDSGDHEGLILPRNGADELVLPPSGEIYTP